MRKDGRQNHELRPVQIQTMVSAYAEGSALIEAGQTRVLCTATIDTTIPRWLIGGGQGWVSAEYGMLPRSTHTRIAREKASSGGRTQEISRLIGRSLRAAVDLKALGERQILVDCDVLQADGGTRTAAITGGFVALALALEKLVRGGQLARSPLKSFVAAVSAGLVGGAARLDLNYDEDSTASTDMNFVMNDRLEFIEIQGTAEASAFSKSELQAMMELAERGCRELISKQSEFVSGGGLLARPQMG